MKSFRQCNQHKSSLTEDQELARNKMLAKVHSDDSSSSGDEDNKNNSNKFVVKHLRPHLLQRPSSFKIGDADLGKEAQILASIQQPNIVKIRGWGSHGLDGYTSDLHDVYFLILDRLYETLERWIKSRKKQTETQASAHSFCSSKATAGVGRSAQGLC